MKFLILAACVCAVMARPQKQTVQHLLGGGGDGIYATRVVRAVGPYSGNEQTAEIVRSSSDVHSQGFNYEVETGNGIVSQASGTLKKVGDAEAVVVQGAYKYTAPDGTPVQFTYVADENGYQPQSDLLPVGPPVPEAIVRAVEYLRTHAPKDSNVH